MDQVCVSLPGGKLLLAQGKILPGFRLDLPCHIAGRLIGAYARILRDDSLYLCKPDPEYPDYKIWVFNVQGQGLVVKKRSRVDPSLMENVEYDAAGKEISRSFEPA